MSGLRSTLRSTSSSSSYRRRCCRRRHRCRLRHRGVHTRLLYAPQTRTRAHFACNRPSRCRADVVPFSDAQSSLSHHRRRRSLRRSTTCSVCSRSYGLYGVRTHYVMTACANANKTVKTVVSLRAHSPPHTQHMCTHMRAPPSTFHRSSRAPCGKWRRNANDDVVVVRVIPAWPNGRPEPEHSRA